MKCYLSSPLRVKCFIKYFNGKIKPHRKSLRNGHTEHGVHISELMNRIAHMLHNQAGVFRLMSSHKIESQPTTTELKISTQGLQQRRSLIDL